MMKKSNLITGFVYILVGLACLFMALWWESKIDGILWGLAGAGIFPGAGMVCKYFYWASPKRKEIYSRRLENEKIERSDELKEKIRDRSGRCAYVLGIIVVSISMLIFSLLDALEIIADARILILYLGAYLLFQIAAGIMFFNRILKKY